MNAATNAQALPDGADPTAEPDEASQIPAFGRAYARWLKAGAQIECPSSFTDDQFMKAAFAEESSALRELFSVPADCSEIVWDKLAVFEIELVRDQVVGTARDSILLLALGSIKTDLMNLGIQGEA